MKASKSKQTILLDQNLEVMPTDTNLKWNPEKPKITILLEKINLTFAIGWSIVLSSSPTPSKTPFHIIYNL